MTTSDAATLTVMARDGAPAVASARRLPFAGAIGLSAFLLFSLELLAGRLVLPVFGGSPAVWTTSLCFFTAVLFIGYSYAHLLVSRLPIRRAGTDAGDRVAPGCQPVDLAGGRRP